MGEKKRWNYFLPVFKAPPKMGVTVFGHFSSCFLFVSFASFYTFFFAHPSKASSDIGGQVIPSTVTELCCQNKCMPWQRQIRGNFSRESLIAQIQIPRYRLQAGNKFWESADLLQQCSIGAGKKQETKLSVTENCPFGAAFSTPKICPKKFMWVPFLHPFPGNEAHKLFSGGQAWGVLAGGQKDYVEKVYVLFWSPTQGGTPWMWIPGFPFPGLFGSFK